MQVKSFRIQSMRNLSLQFCLFFSFLIPCISSVADDATISYDAPQVAENSMSNSTLPSNSWSSTVQEIMLSAISLSGINYKYGGTSPDTGFDCSGFVRYVFQQAANLTLPHGARALSQLGQTVTQDNLQPGDLVFFNTLKSSFSHVGIYLGNNRFIHSPSSGQKVTIMDMNDGYWSKRFNGARRITSTQGGAPAIKQLAQPTPAE